ncbi:MAG: Aminopeptidase YpdF (MP-, MA-, MS-, AP-, NP-specific) [uncultured Sulfurovum sp.]|uniref:Aminopeptidase YpdF (MP-, MA-, MS-, AP-, NP-specific) n=1 Tax=uncultured Sulfurovum sp. TaxID=269237 RepID=A0A6S6TN93_9BACT|nr:MAG: Aminopeptidase YpdF (MP-, MA-, MS-, AP-, NP-specific) [uncultured Sulfurovum sp.]
MNYIVKDENAIYYECGFSSDNALFLKLGSESFFITDSRYTVEAQELVQGAMVIINGDLYGEANKLIKKSNIKKIVYDPKEWSIFHFEKLSENLKINFKSSLDFSHRKRVIKSSEELLLLRKAAKLGASAFNDFADLIHKHGFNQDEKMLTFMGKAMLSKKGKYELSFDPITAVNANAAKPHALPTKTKLKTNDLLLVDAGLKYKRYCSDRTRTISATEDFKFGYAQKFKKKKIQKAYDLVLKAHDNAIEKARSGMKANKIDAFTRDIITKAGYGQYYVHSTGHGVGLDIHEMPYISAKSEMKVEDGMVYTVEPGIYIPGEFGIRIEDMVVMQNGRAEIL